MTLSGPDWIKGRFLAEFHAWLSPSRLYHAFTGVDDDYVLAHIDKLDHVLQSSLLEKAEREWPARLDQVAKQRRKEKEDSKQAVQQFILGLDA